ncbi:site-specific integrase [Pseudomonas sp. UBA2628]|uniref:site-specific integrase n=1 Tax=Pseudomonas sp. UBA2628 TaxID=1947310 RepID=UPI00257E2807|nr:site-specific integrase [Pseudomonas sp. UBA2628]
MKAKITATLLASLKPQDKTYRVHDTAQPGLSIRVLPSGHMSYMVTWARNQARTLGRVRVMTLEQARAEAAKHLSDVHMHGEPVQLTKKRRNDGVVTLESFLTDSFEPWVMAHQKDARNSCRALRKSFAALMPLRLDEIDVRGVEMIRTEWIANGLTMASANRNVTRLRGVLSRALEWGVIETHPLARLKRLKVDKRGRVRFLSVDEEVSLQKALVEREQRIRIERDSANLWREQRSIEKLNDFREQTYVDHLRPMVLLSLYTGMRRGEVFNLRWCDISFERKLITIDGQTSKSGQTRYVPISTKLFFVLEAWKSQSGDEALVFPGKDGKRMDNVKKSWMGVLELAKIQGFRWHDLRHTFASNLAMKGVPINTLRELLGHSDLTMTLQYAHLAPSIKADAVELL